MIKKVNAGGSRKRQKLPPNQRLISNYFFSATNYEEIVLHKRNKRLIVEDEEDVPHEVNLMEEVEIIGNLDVIVIHRRCKRRIVKDEEDVPALYDELLPEPEAPAPLTGFETIALDEVPKIRHKSDRAPRKSKYDFEKLPKAEFDETGKQINVAAIFVGATDKQPNPLKSVQSSLSIVNKKYKGERHFIARNHTKDGVEGVALIRDL